MSDGATGQKKEKSCGQSISTWFWTFWVGNAGKIAMWTFLPNIKVPSLKAQRRLREEVIKAVLEGIQVHNVIENEIKCGVKNSIDMSLYSVD